MNNPERGVAVPDLIRRYDSRRNEIVNLIKN